MDPWLKALGVAVHMQPHAEGEPYTVTHNSTIYAVGPGGELIAVFSAPHDAAVIAADFLKNSRPLPEDSSRRSIGVLMNRLPVLIQRLLPQRLMGRLVYHLARCRRAWISRPLIGWFARRYTVDLREAEHSRLESYSSLNDFFTRRLKPGARPISGDERTLVSPVDGLLTQFRRRRRR